MNLGCIYHRSQDNMCYAKNESELVIQIQTGKEVDRVFLNYRGSHGVGRIRRPLDGGRGIRRRCCREGNWKTTYGGLYPFFRLINGALISLSSGALMRPFIIWRMDFVQTVPGSGQAM